jgi:hypothetical protein
VVCTNAIGLINSERGDDGKAATGRMQRTFAEFGRHYGTNPSSAPALAAGQGKGGGTDRAAVDLARMRGRRFDSLGAQRADRGWLPALHRRVMRHRLRLFWRLDKPAPAITQRAI